MTYTIDFASDVKLSLNPTEEEATLQNLYCLVHTALAEVPCYREFGIDKSYISMPSNVAETMIVSAIADGMGEFFPELSVENLSFESDQDEPDSMAVRIEVTDDE